MFKNRRKGIATRILSAFLAIALTVTLCPNDMGYVMAEEVTIGATITGVITDEESQPLEGVGIVVTDSESNMAGSATTISGGTFTVENLNDELSYTITATKEGYKSASQTVVFDGANNLVLTEKTEGGIAFDVTEASVTVGGTLTKTATATDGEGDATSYTSSEPGVATVDNSGVVTPIAVGTTIITATRSETEDYKKATASYTLNVTKGTQSALTWKNEIPTDLTWKDVFENTVTGGTGNGAITYTSSNTEVAEVDANTGILTLKKPGEVTITATKSGGNSYEDVTAQYTLTVNKAKQAPLVFADKYPDVIYVGDVYSNIATGGSTGETITYSSLSTATATIDSSGNVTAKQEGSSIITATLTGNDYYEDVSATYMITIKPAAEKSTYAFQKGTAITMYVGDTIANPAINVGDDVTVTYSSNASEIADVDTSGNITAKGTGTATITATDESTSIQITCTVTVKEGSQMVTFAKGNGTISCGETYTNVATATTTVTYTSSDDTIATVDINGVVTGLKEGNVIITGTAAAENGYTSAVGQYALRVNSKTQTVSFAKSAPIVTFNDNNNEYTNLASTDATNTSDNTVKYSVVSGNATVNKDTGLVEITGAGTIVIEATYSGNDEYASASATYTLTVNKASQTIAFDENTFTITLGNTFTAPVATETGTKYGSGTITYEKTEDENSILQTFDTATGTFTLTGNVGSATIKATKAADDNYESATTSYTLTVQKKGQAIEFPLDEYSVWTGSAFDAPQALVTSTESTQEAIVYAIEKDDNGIIAEIKADTGKVTLSGNVGTATIKATKPGDASFDDATATYTLTVNQWTANNTMYTITDTKGLTGDVWFKGAVSIKAVEGYQIRLDGTDEWVSEKEIIAQDTDTTATDISFYVKELEHGYVSAKVTESIKKDGTVPTAKITYEGKTWWDTILLFFNQDADKKYVVESSDNTSGVASIQYYIDEDNTVIKTDEQLDAITIWTDYDTVNFINVDKGKKYVVYAKVTDNAGNYVYATTNGIVHDIAKPTVTFEATSNGSKYSDNSTDIYSDDITLKITVQDPAPYSGIKSVNWKVYNDSEEVVSDSYTPKKTGDVAYSDLEYEFIKELELTKEVYTGSSIRVQVEVEDFSGHTTIEEKTYAISATKPSITVTYTDMDSAPVVDGRTGYFKGQRKATVVITCSDSLFDENEATNGIVITAKDSRNEDVPLDADMISDWVTDDSGMDTEDTHTATILFSKDANYTFDIAYANKLNQKADVTYINDPVTPNSFAVDTVAPTITVAYTDGDSNPIIDGEKGYFKGERIATITIDEATTFASDEVVIAITAKDSEGKAVLSKEQLDDLVSDFNITSDNKYQATIEYSEDANYTFDIQYKDKAGHNAVVEMGNSVTPMNFTVDQTNPEGKIKVGKEWSWDRFLELISFGLYNSNQPQIVTVESADKTSGVKSVHYHKTTTSEIKTADELKAIDESFWSEYDSSFEIAPNSKIIVYARIIDKMGHTIYLCTDGIILEDKTPVVTEKIKPEVTLTAKEGADTIYSSDVTVAVEVNEPTEDDMFSGLQWVKYEVSSLGAKTQEGTLYELNKNTNEFVTSWASTEGVAESFITVNSSLNNSNSVVVKVIACDRAGNMGEETLNLKIDMTAPQITVSYDNNDGDTSFSDTTYFNKARTATITIRENNFDPAKVSLNASGGASALNWSSSADNANGDGGIHRASISFASDGDYTFGISCVDKVGHTSSNVDYGSSLAPMKFTVDITEPQVIVSYDNNNAVNGNYYNETRVATIQVKEHNFEVSRVNFAVTATDNGQQAVLPTLSNWVSNGDTHTATVVYDKDALYTFDFDYTDKAGNKAADIPMETFYVDQTAPSVSISNIVDESANSGEGNIGFSITATDTNFDVFTPVLTAVVKEGDKFVEKQISGGGFSNIGNGQVFTIRNVDADGIYRISCTVVDKAGNAYTEVSLQNKDGSTYVEEHTAADTLLTFSVNRQGSAYELDENTMETVKQYYVQNVDNDVVLVEVNTNSLKEYKVTLNGKELVEGTDYTVTTEGGHGEWMKYIYSIEKSLFEAEGQYQVVVSSIDEADNNAFSDVKDATVTFVVDRTAPLVTVSGLETDGRYQVERQTVTIIPTDDGGALKSLLVRTVDEDGKELVKLVDLSGDELTAALDENDGKITFEIEEGLYQNVQIICNDCAIDGEGNTNTYNMTFYQVSVSSSAVKMLFASKGMRYGIIGGIVLIAGGVALLIFRRKKVKK